MGTMGAMAVMTWVVEDMVDASGGTEGLLDREGTEDGGLRVAGVW